MACINPLHREDLICNCGILVRRECCGCCNRENTCEKSKMKYLKLTNPFVDSNNEQMQTDKYKPIIYTIEVDWIGGNVWLNNHISKEKMVISEKDAKYIYDAFSMLNAKNNGIK